MEERKLEIYTFNVHTVRKVKDQANLNNINGIDLFKDMVSKFTNFVDVLPPDQIGRKTCRIEKSGNLKSQKTTFLHNDTGRYISGKILIGEDDGKEQDVVKSNKTKEYQYTKQKGQSIERPFYFMMVFPLNCKDGFLIIEREGKHSIKTFMTILIKNYVKEISNSLDVKFKNFIEEAVIRKYLEEGDYNSIIVDRNVLAKEKSQQLLGAYQDKGSYKMSFIIQPKGDAYIPIITKKLLLKNMGSQFGFFKGTEFEDIGFDDQTNVKVVSTYNNNTRTIDLGDTMKVRPYYIVNTAINSRGFSDFQSINKEAVKLLRELSLNII